MVYIIGMITMVVNAWSGSVGESIARAVFMLTPSESTVQSTIGGRKKSTQHHSNYELRHHVGWRILRERGARVPLDTHKINC